MIYAHLLPVQNCPLEWSNELYLKLEAARSPVKAVIFAQQKSKTWQKGPRCGQLTECQENMTAFSPSPHPNEFCNLLQNKGIVLLVWSTFILYDHS